MRALAAAVMAAALLAGCTPEAPEQVPADGPAVPADVATSRQVLGDPLVAVGEAVLALEQHLSEARHEAARGRAMRVALRDVEDDIAETAEAAAAAAAAAEQAPIEDAAQIVRQAASDATHAAAEAERELEFLRRVAEVDRQLLAAAASWDRRGSQSEVRARLAEVAEDLRAVRRRARRLQPVPDACPVLAENRREWARTVRRRTVRLQSFANSAGGRTFDELRASYRGLPFGVEPRTADAEDAACWRDHSAVPAAAEALRQAVEDLQTTLS